MTSIQALSPNTVIIGSPKFVYWSPNFQCSCGSSCSHRTRCGRGVRDGGYTWIQKYGFLLINTHLSTTIAEHPVSQPQRPTLSSHYSSIPSLISQLPGSKLMTLNHVRFILIEKDIYSGYEFAFSACNASSKIAMMDIQNALSTVVVFYTALLLL